MKKLLFIFSLVLYGTYLNAQDMPIKLPAIISDHAVLQQGTNVKLWGWGPATRQIGIVGSWAPNDTVKTLVADECTWETTIKTPGAGGPYTIRVINDTSVVTIHDIMIGEVWLCAGQSNMALPCNAGIKDTGEALNAPANKDMRFFMPEFAFDTYPRSDCNGRWVICEPATMAYFSAVGYFFGRALQDGLHVPLGLIGSYMGATRIQTWMPKYAIEADAELIRVSEHIGAAWVPQGISTLYNGMIHPLAPYTLSGAIWYQGETNACVDQEARCYGKMLRGLITSWRKEFDKDFPFYFVQIAPFDGYYPKDAAAYLREQQETALVMPKTGMITVGDLVDSVKDIHPKLKAAVGKRMANLVLKEQYQLDSIQATSPRFAKMLINKDEVTIVVSSAGKLTSNDQEIVNFQVAGRDRVFYPAKASVAKNGDVMLVSKKVKVPVAVRYCFSNEGMPNLFDTNGLPLLPFRTDKW